jgi:glycerate-2-kinase
MANPRMLASARVASGGRCQEFALVPELATMETPSCSRPGPTGATGRRRPPRRSWTRRRSSAHENGLAVRHALAENDSHRFVVALGDDLVVTGPTGSTLMDLYRGLIN